MRPLLPFVLAAGLAGCHPSTLEAPLVPNPVLLGPVDRVGGHRADSGRTLRSIEGEASDRVSSSKDAASGVRTTTAIHEGSGSIATQILQATEGRSDRDVRIDAVPAGAYAMVSSGSFYASQWVGLKARVVEVGHDR